MTECPWHRFALIRDIDETGVSGAGMVAEGVEFSDGTCILRWRPVSGYTQTSIAVWPDSDALLAVHGHDGKTYIKWIDE